MWIFFLFWVMNEINSGIATKTQDTVHARDDMADGLMEIIGAARGRATPSAESVAAKKQTADLLLARVREQCRGKPEILSVQLGGSYPKGTWVSDFADLDIFIGFRKDTPRETFTRMAHGIGFGAMKGFGPYVRYSEHPFVEATINGTKINVVPHFVVSRGEWQSAADRTTHHTDFMTNSLSEQMRGDVRLLKTFLKANGLYGSEIAKRGFSGYSTEVLIHHMKSFVGVLGWFAGARRGQVIGTTTQEFDTPIAIIDPIDPNRNLAAAISEENIGRLIVLCRAFLARPAISFFETRPQRSIRPLNEGTVYVKFRYEPRSADKLWGQLQKAAVAVARQLDRNGFQVIRSGSLTDNGSAVIYFQLESNSASTHYVREGPDVFNGEATSAFIAKNRPTPDMMWFEGGRIRSLAKRPESTHASEFITALLARRLDASGMPAGLKPDIRSGFCVRYGRDGMADSLETKLFNALSTEDALRPPTTSH